MEACREKCLFLNIRETQALKSENPHFERLLCALTLKKKIYYISYQIQRHRLSYLMYPEFTCEM